MVSCYSGDHIAEDHIDTDIIICKSEESQQKCRLGTVSNRYLRGGGLNMLYWARNWPSSSVIVQPSQKITIHSTDQNCCKPNITRKQISQNHQQA